MWRVGSKHYNHRSSTRDSPWTTTVQHIHRTTDDTFTKVQHSPPPICRQHSTLCHSPTNQPYASPHAYGSLRKHVYDNGVVMNDNKLLVIVICSSSLRMPTSLSHINICGQFVDTMMSQVANMCHTAYYLSSVMNRKDMRLCYHHRM